MEAFVLMGHWYLLTTSVGKGDTHSHWHN